MIKRRSAIHVYYLIVMLWSFAFSLITTVNLVYQASVAGLSPLQLVLVGTTLEITTFIFEVPTGIVADVYSRRLSVIIGYVLIGIGFLVEASLPLFGAILVAQIIWGIGITFVSGAENAWLIDEIGEALAGQVMLRGSQLGNLGALLGIGLSALIAAAFSVNVPIFLGALLCIVLAGLLALLMPETGFQPIPREHREGALTHMIKTLRGGIKVVRGRPILPVIFAVIFFGGLYSEGFDRLWTPHVLENFTLPPLGVLDPVVWFGILRAATMISGIIMAEVVRRTVTSERSQSVLRAIFLSDAGLMISLLAFALTQNFWVMAAAYVISQTLRSAINPIFYVWYNRAIDPSVRATTLSMMNQMDALGQIGGGPAIGAIGERFGVRAALTISALLLTPVLPLYARLAQLAGRTPLTRQGESAD